MGTYFKKLTLDGVDDYVSTPYHTSLNSANYTSFEMWFEPDGMTDPSYPARRVVGGGSPDFCWSIGLNAYAGNPRCVQFWVSQNGTTWDKYWVQTTTSVAATGLHHLVFTCALGQPVIYINGSALSGWLKVTDHAMTALAVSSTDLEVGKYGKFAADLYQYNLWGGTAVLSPADVAARYAAGPVADPAAYTPASGCSLVSAWNRNTSLTYPTIPDNVGSNDAVMVNMTSGDIVDSAYEVAPYSVTCPDRHTLVLTFDAPIENPSDNLFAFLVVPDATETPVTVVSAEISDSALVATLHMETGMSPGGAYTVDLDGLLDATGSPVVTTGALPFSVPSDDVEERAEWEHGLLRVITRAAGQEAQNTYGRLATLSRNDYDYGDRHLFVESTLGWPERGAFFLDGKRFFYRGTDVGACKLLNVKADFPDLDTIPYGSLVLLDASAVPEADFALLWPVGSFTP